MTATFFVFIVSSRNNPIYEQFDAMRRSQLNSLDIPHKFLLNGPLPDGYVLQTYEEHSDDASFNPGMFRKFYNGCKELAKNPLPDFIIRVNSSTFVDFEKFQDKFLNIFPRTGLFGGPIVTDYTVPHMFVHGSFMMFSKDVMYNFLNNTTVDHAHAIQYNDDVAISYIIAETINNTFCQYLQYLISYSAVTSEDYHVEIPDFAFIVRVKNEVEREKNDIYVWKKLMKFCRLE